MSSRSRASHLNNSVYSERICNIDVLEPKDLEVSESEPNKEFELCIASSNNEVSDEQSSYF
jgi:hypothetical protein